MRILLSSLLFLLIGCASYPTQEGFTAMLPDGLEKTTSLKRKTNPYFSDAAIDYVYRAEIAAYGNTFSGILAIKKKGEGHHRLAFTTQMGNTIFDFTFNGTVFKVNSIIAQLDKKILIAILRKDFQALLTELPGKQELFKKGEDEVLMKAAIGAKNHFYRYKKNQLKSITRTKGAKENMTVTFEQVEKGLAQQITIAHSRITLIIALRAI